jgi:hypothetical protein
MVITYRQKFLFAKALAERNLSMFRKSSKAVPFVAIRSKDAGVLSPLPCPTVFEYRLSYRPINVTPNKKLSMDYYLSSGRQYVEQGQIGQIALCEAEAVVGPPSSRSSAVVQARALSLLEIIFRHLFWTRRIGIHLSHFLVDRFGLVSRIKL